MNVVAFLLVLIAATVIDAKKGTKSLRAQERDAMRHLESMSLSGHSKFGRTLSIPTKINADGEVVEEKKMLLHPHSHGLVETSDNEEHARKLAATPQDYYIGQIYGGSMCNGRTYESIVVKTNVCYTFMDYSQEPNWEQARDTPQPAKDTDIKVSFIFNTTSNTVRVAYYIVIPMNASSGYDMRVFCDPDAAKDYQVTLENNFGQPYFMESNEELFTSPSYGFGEYILAPPASNKPQAVPGSCLKSVSGYDEVYVQTPPRAFYNSIRVDKLSDRTTWKPTADTPSLCPSITGGNSYAFGTHTNSVDGEIPWAMYFAYQSSLCQTSVSVESIYSSSDDDYGNDDGNDDGDDDDNSMSPDTGLAGYHPLRLANMALYTDYQDSAYHSSKSVCMPTGEVKTTWYKDERCSESMKMFTNTFGGSEQKLYYISGVGSASNTYFSSDDDTSPSSNVTMFSYMSMGCMGSGLPSPLTEGSVGTSGLKGNYKWAHVEYYTDDKCSGPIYGKDSLQAGKLYQCMVEDTTWVGNATSTKIPAQSYIIECYANGMGFKKTFFDDLECKGAVVPYPEMVEQYEVYFLTDNHFYDNGTCMNYDRGDKYGDGPMNFQSKTYRYVCSNSPPTGMGWTTEKLSGLDCTGFQTGGSTFNIALGTNYSAYTMDTSKAPNSAPYTIKNTCSGGALTSTYTAQKTDKVQYTSFESTVPEGCQVLVPLFVGSATTTTAGSARKSCDSDATDAASSSASLSGGAIAGIVIGVLVLVGAILGAGYFISTRHKQEEVRRASVVRASQARASQAEMSTVKTPMHYPSNTAPPAPPVDVQV
jgi:hypothetical protein